MPLRATLDTNVFVSGLISSQGPPRRIIDAWVEGAFTLVISPYLISELRRVLDYPRIASRLNLTEIELAVLFRALSERAVVTAGTVKLSGVTRKMIPFLDVRLKEMQTTLYPVTTIFFQ